MCATLVIKKNPLAPEILLIGSKRKNMQLAEEYCNEQSEIPVFMGLSKNRWKYAGLYKYASHTTDPSRLKEWQGSRKEPSSRAIFLRATDPTSNSFVDMTIDASATEGAPKLYRHEVRERNRALKKLKINQFLA